MSVFPGDRFAGTLTAVSVLVEASICPNVPLSSLDDVTLNDAVDSPFNSVFDETGEPHTSGDSGW